MIEVVAGDPGPSQTVFFKLSSMELQLEPVEAETSAATLANGEVKTETKKETEVAPKGGVVMSAPVWADAMARALPLNLAQEIKRQCDPGNAYSLQLAQLTRRPQRRRIPNVVLPLRETLWRYAFLLLENNTVLMEFWTGLS